MSRRKEKVQKVDSDDDDDDEVTTNQTPKVPKKSNAGINWAAVVLLLMMILPAIMTAYIHVIDYLYPEAAKIRPVRDKVVKCYSVANPSKLNDVDRLLEKYKGKEHKLLASLRGKYEDIPECN